jgi:cellulose synthase/poly-beta-1,6-N-acetylglucosamine synthase-like glycosyltransferase
MPQKIRDEIVDQDEPSDHQPSDRVEIEENQKAKSAPTREESTLTLVEKTKSTFFAMYSPKVDAPLILPSAPTDQEKLGYLHTNRLPLYAAGVFSFLSLTAGMWLFVISSQYFAWFGVFCGLLQTYLFISYAVGLIGKDFDFENHQKVVTENQIVPETSPTVDIFLPCCKEPLEILKNTYEHVRKLEYPAGKLKVYVLDDGAMESVERLARSYSFEYICRDDRPRLKKAGNLRWAFARTDGDFFAIYDADFCPRSDFLLELLPMMLTDEEVAIVQSPQFFRTLKTQTWVEQGAGAVQELFYRVVQVNRDRWGASICVGSNAVYRRAALIEVGGTAEIGFSEDVHTGFGCVDRGWKVKYNPLCLACGVCPDTPRAFFSQQMRWCMGSTTLLSNPEFWKSNLTVGQKICYLCGMMYYSAVSLSIFVNPLPGIFLLWIRPDHFKYYNLAFAVPSLLYTLITFRLWAKASFSINVQFIMVIQSYAYFTAIKDRICGRALAWAPSGDSKSHKHNKYRNMRIMAWCWLFIWQGALIAGVTYRIIRGMAWWNTIPLLVLDTFNFFLAHRFLFCW